MRSVFRQFYSNLFLETRLFSGLSVSVALFIVSFFLPWLGIVPFVFFLAFMVLVGIDVVLLYRTENGISASRTIPERLSNSDENPIVLRIENRYAFKAAVEVIDEIPFQFQQRDWVLKTILKSGADKIINYSLRPVKRGEYEFGDLLVYVKSPLAFISRKYRFRQAVTVPVYPSFLQMRKYQLLAISNRLNEMGIKRIRRIGQNMEFEQVKNYISGDDPRTINWKATARKAELMVNSFIDEKSQYVYCVIDKSRSMRMPFNGLSLLDYAINASLTLSSVALLKEDKAGLITISEKVGSVIAADRKPSQLNRIMEVLYREKTRYLETNMEALYTSIRGVIKQRSLVVYFTNFESFSSMERQLPFLRRIAGFHLLLVVFFENSELKDASASAAQDVEDIYVKTIAGNFIYEKRQIVKELARHGIASILTSPEKLTVNTVNRYLEIKATQRM